MLGFRGSKSGRRVTLSEVFPGGGRTVMFSTPLERERGVGTLAIEGPRRLRGALEAHVVAMAMQDSCWSSIWHDDEDEIIFVTYDFGALDRRISPIELLSFVLLKSLATKSLLLVSPESKLDVVDGRSRITMGVSLPRGIRNGTIELAPLVIQPGELY